MSFYFAKHPAKPSGPPLVNAPRRAFADVPALHRAGCSACPLNHAQIDTPKMQPTFGTGPIYFLAEAPGEHEDETSHKPLTGPTGTLLRQCLPDGWSDLYTFDNVVNCRPPKNRTPVWNEVECCRPRRIKWIEQVKPKLIVGLGAVPLQWALGSTDVAGMRGRLFAIKVGNHVCWFLPTYHPSYVLRTCFDKKNPLRSRFGHCLKMDVQKAVQLGIPKNGVSMGLRVPVIDSEAEIRLGVKCYDGTSPGHFTELCTLLSDAGGDVAAIDIETRGLRPFTTDSAIMSVAVATERSTFVFAVSHPEGSWTAEQAGRLKALFKGLVRNPKGIRIAHNSPFELEWFIWWLGRDAVNHDIWHCTQMQAHFLDERRGRQSTGDSDHRAPYQNLDFLIKQHFGFHIKSLFKLNKKDMGKEPLVDVMLYNGIDAKYTLKLWQRQSELLKEEGLWKAYLEALPRQATVALMQTLGVEVDQEEVRRLQARFEPEIELLNLQVQELEAVQVYRGKYRREFNPLSTDDVIQILIDLGFEKQITVKSVKKALDFGVDAKAKKRALEGHKPKYSVDRKVLEKIKHPLSPLIIDLRNRTKLKSTYVDGLERGKGALIYPDGKVHCNFNTTFAETGRTSSDGPNMQNFPQREDAWIRAQIVAPKGYLLAAFDYGQLEGCTAAMCSRDKVLVKSMWEDYDIHMEWARKVHEKYPAIGPVDKELRSRIKGALVFAAIFGAQNKSIAGYLSMPEHLVDELMDEFWDTFSGLKQWQDNLMRHYYQTGWVESPTGRRHRYPLIRPQVINHPVQSLACDIVCNAMNELSRIASESGQWHLHPVLNVHDDLTFVLPDSGNDLEEAIKSIYSIMLTPPYKCVNVPMSVEAKLGKNWHQLHSIGKFWSHKDL